MAIWHKIKANAQDWPGLVTLVLALVVAVHYLLVRRFSAVPDPFGALAKTDPVTDLYLGALGFSTLLAGFAGIVVVFAMSPESESLRRLREFGGKRLAANWVAPVTTSILSAMACSFATAFALHGDTTLGGWTFEFASLAALHGALRMVWLLRSLVNIVSKEDKSNSATEEIDLKDIPATNGI